MALPPIVLAVMWTRCFKYFFYSDFAYHLKKFAKSEEPSPGFPIIGTGIGNVAKPVAQIGLEQGFKPSYQHNPAPGFPDFVGLIERLT